jgi:hypothetical protein
MDLAIPLINILSKHRSRQQNDEVTTAIGASLQMWTAVLYDITRRRSRNVTSETEPAKDFLLDDTN